MEPGEVLYYGRGWNHETQNVDDPTATLTDTAVHAQNYGAVADKLHSECGRKALDFKFSGARLSRTVVFAMSPALPRA